MGVPPVPQDNGRPFLPPEDVVKAVVTSTRRYLELLLEQDAGGAKHRAVGIHLAEEPSLLLDNETWRVYDCNVPQHLTNLRPDTSATLLPENTPGSKIEVRILEYDRRTGRAKFASRVCVPGETGAIRIDFRWLVRRCLNWYEQRGTSIPPIKEAGKWVSEIPTPFSGEDGLSGEQACAINTVLTAGLSYVWGPPGTGKTQYVLARAVRRCVGNGKKALEIGRAHV